jgi:hypothetical protein
VIPALVRSPRTFKKVVLICPTGYGSLDRPSGHLGDAICGLFLAPVLGDVLYHTIVSQGASVTTSVTWPTTTQGS